MANATCRWGILGTANIARKNWQSIANSGNGTLLAVASRSAEKAQQFIRDCQTYVPFPTQPRSCSYEELLAAPDIDAVYIPLPTGIRKEWVLRAAAAGKHVLCEKPCGVNSADLQEMIAACQKANVQFMDGVMFMHSQRLPKLSQILADGKSIGEIKRITSQFSFCAPEEFLRGNIRVSDTLEPLGCLGDLGWYNLRLTLWALNYQLPTHVSGRIILGTSANQPVPLEFSAELLFAGGTSASFYCSFVAENQQWAVISGTKGFVRIPDFVLPYFGSEAAFEVTQAAFDTNHCQFNMNNHTERIAVREYSNNLPGSQETELFRNFGRLALSGKPDSHWPEIALKTQQVLDACLRSAQQGGKLLPVA